VEALPPAFRIAGDLPPHSAGLLQWVRDRPASYSAAEQAVIDEMVGPPERVQALGRVRGFGMGAAGLAECFANIRMSGGQAEDTPLIGQLIATRHMDIVPILPPNALPQVMAMLQQRVEDAFAYANRIQHVTLEMGFKDPELSHLCRGGS